MGLKRPSCQTSASSSVVTTHKYFFKRFISLKVIKNNDLLFFDISLHIADFVAKIYQCCSRKFWYAVFQKRIEIKI